MKRVVVRLMMAAGLAVLLAGAPIMAAVGGPDGPDTDESTTASNGSGPADLEFLNRPRHGRSEKPKPKRRDPGRQNMNGIEAGCVNDGFVGGLFGGLVGILRGCDDGETGVRGTR